MTADLIDEEPGQESLPDHARLGRYRLVQRLGEGGMGTVHLALDEHGRAVALKVLRPHVAHDPAARARLSREVETLSRIRSPRVAPVIDADVDGERPFIVTRYVPGPPLDEHVEAHGRLPAPELHRVGYGLAEALDAIHAVGVVHRDLKPGNVLLVDGDPVLIDFGIAHAVEDVRLTLTGLVMGTPGYLAPEIIEGASVQPATDWWGWAATLAYAASGEPPFGRGSMDVVLSRVVRGEADLGAVDPRIAPLLHAALSPHPEQRPHSSEVVAGLERWARGGAVTEAVRLPRSTSTEVLHVASTTALPVARDAAPPSVGVPAALGAGPGAAPVRAVPAGADQRGVDQRGADRAGALSPASSWDPFGDPPPPGPGEQALAGGLDERLHVDPRIGRPGRTGTLAAMLALLAAAAATAPVLAAAGLIGWTVLARTADRSVTATVMRRHERGRRASDIPVAVVAGPWHVLVATVGAAFSAVMPLLVGSSAAFASALVVVTVQGGSPEPAAPLPLGVAGAVAGLVAWWGPGGASLRRGTRSLVRGISPGPSSRVWLVVVLLLAAGMVLGWGLLGGGPVWWPAATAPDNWSGAGLLR